MNALCHLSQVHPLHTVFSGKPKFIEIRDPMMARNWEWGCQKSHLKISFLNQSILPLISPSSISHRMTLKWHNVTNTILKCRTELRECTAWKPQAKPTVWPQLLLFRKTLFNRGILQKSNQNLKTGIPKVKGVNEKSPGFTAPRTYQDTITTLSTTVVQLALQYQIFKGFSLLPSCCAQLTSLAKLS